MTHSLSLLVVGCGRMGSAMVQRWAQSTKPHYDIHIIEHNRESFPKLEALGDDIHCYGDIAELAQDHTPDLVLFAVKPQMLADVLPAYAERFGTQPTYLSVAAGMTLGFYQNYLGEDARIIRIMPNTPSMIGEGMSAFCGSDKATQQDMNRAGDLLSAVGEVLPLETEDKMDAVTAISGSGPAYVFYFMESLVKAGIKLGLTEDEATLLAKQTVKGSSLLAAQSCDDLATLRENVTSPGGTTQAALNVWMAEDGLAAIAERACDAAERRAKELAC